MAKAKPVGKVTSRKSNAKTAKRQILNKVRKARTANKRGHKKTLKAVRRKAVRFSKSVHVRKFRKRQFTRRVRINPKRLKMKSCSVYPRKSIIKK